MSSFRFKSLKNRRGGFSLIEMLISIVIFSIVMGIIYTYLLRSKEGLFQNEEELKAADNAQIALRVLRDDLSRIGLGRDTEEDQPRILRCEPYSIVFVADLDRDKRARNERYGAWVNSYGPPTGDPVFRYLPIQASVTNAGDWGWNTAVDYGVENDGAEIIRYSLDYNADNRILNDDTENAITIDPDMTHNQNPADFYLVREIWGCIEDTTQPTGFRNAYSGPQLVAFNMRGNLYNTTSPSLDRTNFIYPNNQWPQLLFTYWGHYLNTLTTPDLSSDPNWPGEPLDLWGDWGGGNPPTNDYIPSGDIGDGVLSQAEVIKLMTDPLYSRVFVLHPEDPAGATAAIADSNGNGIPGENRIDQVIRRIGINVITETGSASPKFPNLEHSNLTASPPIYYNYKDYRASLVINPPNLIYEGAPPNEIPPAVSTPIPPTPTMRPTYTPTYGPGTPSPTPLETETPTPDLTASGTPAATATPTPDLSSNYDEVAFGMLSFIRVLGLNKTRNPPLPLYDGSPAFPPDKGYPAFNSGMSLGRVVDIEEVNFCNLPDNPDLNNDVVYISDHPLAFEPNLFYMPHTYPPQFSPFNPLDQSGKKSFRVGLNNMVAMKMALGEIDYDSTVQYSGYPEIFCAVREQTTPSRDHIYITGISGPCGNFIDKGFQPFSLPSGIQITDMLTADLDHDQFAELIITTNSNGSLYPQLVVFKDLDRTIHGDWIVQFSIDQLYTGESYPTRLNRGAITHTGILYPDLITISDFGHVQIIENLGEDAFSHLWLGLSTPPCNPGITLTTPVTGSEVYPTGFASSDYDRLAVVINSTTEHYSQYHKTLTMPGCTDFDNIPICSGLLYPATSIANPQVIDWFDIERSSGRINVLAIFSIIDSVQREVIFIANPCSSDESINPPISFNFPVYCITSIRNAHSNEPLN